MICMQNLKKSAEPWFIAQALAFILGQAPRSLSENEVTACH